MIKFKFILGYIQNRQKMVSIIGICGNFLIIHEYNNKLIFALKFKSVSKFHNTVHPYSIDHDEEERLGLGSQIEATGELVESTKQVSQHGQRFSEVVEEVLGARAGNVNTSSSSSPQSSTAVSSDIRSSDDPTMAAEPNLGSGNHSPISTGDDDGEEKINDGQSPKGEESPKGKDKESLKGKGEESPKSGSSGNSEYKGESAGSDPEHDWVNVDHVGQNEAEKPGLGPSKPDDAESSPASDVGGDASRHES